MPKVPKEARVVIERADGSRLEATGSLAEEMVKRLLEERRPYYWWQPTWSSGSTVSVVGTAAGYTLTGNSVCDMGA